MASIADDMRGGFDTYIAGERSLAGATVVTLAQFDDRYDVVYDNRPIDDVPPLVLEPRGTTALLDAIGRFVTDVGHQLAGLPEADRPDRVVILVVTDGMENASVEWESGEVRQLVSRQEDEHHWDFVFLGANIDAIDVGTGLGFSADRSLTYDPSSAGVAGAFESVTRYRKASSMMCGPEHRGVGFDDADRRRARGR